MTNPHSINFHYDDSAIRILLGSVVVVFLHLVSSSLTFKDHFAADLLHLHLHRLS